jgi:hypothetical protein
MKQKDYLHLALIGVVLFIFAAVFFNSAVDGTPINAHIELELADSPYVIADNIGKDNSPLTVSEREQEKCPALNYANGDCDRSGACEVVRSIHTEHFIIDSYSPVQWFCVGKDSSMAIEKSDVPGELSFCVPFDEYILVDDVCIPIAKVNRETMVEDIAKYCAFFEFHNTAALYQEELNILTQRCNDSPLCTTVPVDVEASKYAGSTVSDYYDFRACVPSDNKCHLVDTTLSGESRYRIDAPRQCVSSTLGVSCYLQGEKCVSSGQKIKDAPRGIITRDILHSFWEFIFSAFK